MPKKVKRNQRAKRSSGKFLLATIVLLLVAGIIGYIAARQEAKKADSKQPDTVPIQQPTISVPNRAIVRPTDWIMSAQRAHDYSVQIIDPILVKHANDPNELASISSRIVYLSRKVDAEEVGYDNFGALHPVKKLFAQTDWDAPRLRPRVILFIPMIMEEEQKLQNRRDFEDRIITIVAHEVIHLEQDSEYPLKMLDELLQGHPLLAESEAVALGKTIIEIARPMIAQGRNPGPEWQRLSDELRKVNDNYRDPIWIKAVGEGMYRN